MSEHKILTGKSILMVSPVFFGYEAAIKNKLVELGADVTYVDDQPSNNSFLTWWVSLERMSHIKPVPPIFSSV